MPKPARRGRKGQNGSKIPRAMPSTVATANGPGSAYRFIRSRDFSLSLPKAAADQGFALSFALDDLPAYTEFTGLFDRYKVEQMDFVFLWQAGVTANPQPPCMWIAADWDGVPGSPVLTDVMQYPGVRMHAFSVQRPTFQYSVKRPGIQQTVAGGSNAAIVRSPWLDCGVPSIEHYGVMGFVSQYNSTVSSGTLFFTIRAHLSFQAPR